MSITFTFAASDGDIDIIGIPCAQCEALAALVDWSDQDNDADSMAYITHVDSCESKSWDVNMHNSGAYQVMRAIGMEPCDIGIADPAKLMELIENNCTWPVAFEGYVASRILRIYALAKQAMDRKVQVGWS